MESTIPTQFWGLYATGELKRVQQFCELGKALELLASNSADQAASIPDCPACEIWAAGFLPVHQFIDSFPDALPPSFTAGLQHFMTWATG